MNRMYLVIGDWSDDGHGKYEKILVEVNKTAKEVQNAYKASCKLTGISFNGNDDYTESGRDWEEAGKFQIAVEYEDSKLTEEALEILNKFKCPKEIIENYTEEAYIHTYVPLWFWFVGLSLPELEYKVSSDGDGIPNINGYWDKNLNAGFGYGLFM